MLENIMINVIHQPEIIFAVILYGTLQILASMDYIYFTEDLFMCKEVVTCRWSPDKESTVT